jgi:uncharacterized membrane protein YhaH (DUF805 family)
MPRNGEIHVTFTQAISTCFSKFVDFSGRASRSEFWWFFLFQVIVLVVASIVHPVLYLIVALGLLLPGTGASVRRLHDTGRTGWWVLISLVPLIGLVLIYFLALEGNTGANQYGDPVVASDDMA